MVEVIILEFNVYPDLKHGIRSVMSDVSPRQIYCQPRHLLGGERCFVKCDRSY